MPPLNLYARLRFFVQFCTRDRGCSVRPVFPAPSDWRGRDVHANLGARGLRDREVVSEFLLPRPACGERVGGPSASPSLPRVPLTRSRVLATSPRIRLRPKAASADKSG